MRIACVVDENIETAERSDGMRDHRLDVGAFGNVAMACQRVLADSARNISSTVAVEVGDDNLRAFSSEKLGNAAPKAGRRSGNDCDFIFEAHRGRPHI